MEAGAILINGIFNGSRLLEVPFYQRSYVWNEEQWERFLYDMEFVSKTKKPYFLGSIILKKGKTPNTWESFSDCKVVIDGQQRLTTLMIFFKALCLKNNNNELFNRDFLLEDGATSLQHGKNDIVDFETVVKQIEATELENITPTSQIISAYNYFLNHINTSKLDRNVIKQNIQFVCIDLLAGEDEQQVFDTINSLGVRLTTAELLKNYFFNKDNVEEYEEKWVSVFEKDTETRLYWEQELETGRITRSLIDIFFDAYFQIFIQNKQYKISTEDKIIYSRVENLSKSYQSFINTYCDGDKKVILDSMAEYAKIFSEVFRPDFCNMGIPANPGIERINIVVFGLKNTTLIPYLLYAAKNIQNQSELNKIYGILESYIMRRLVVHATTKNYNNLFTSLILNEVLTSRALIERLQKNNDSTTFIPNDEELLNGFHNAKLVNLQTRGILYLIESGIRPSHSSTALLGFNNYSLEHLLPKKWRNHWDSCDSEELSKHRDYILLTLGNLAIIPQPLNSSIRDDNWNTKKQGKGNNPGLNICASGLSTIHDVLQKDVWNEDEIYNRAEWLNNQAKLLWTL